MNRVIILSGPTATGKSACAIQLAQACQAEVVNFDSLLFYRELNIGTAKPSPAELNSVVHHMVNVASIHSPLNAANFAAMARPIIDQIHQRGQSAILVGGSGFYLQALIAGMWASPSTPPEVTLRSDTLYQQEGITPFLVTLAEQDRESFLRLHANDHYRIRRAVEHFWTHHTPFSQAKDSFTPQAPPDWQLLHLHLDLPKEEHLRIIEQRTQRMLQE